MTRKQAETLVLLRTEVLDNMEHEQDEYSDAVVVSGDDEDGPRVCYVETDGTCSWLC